MQFPPQIALINIKLIKTFNQKSIAVPCTINHISNSGSVLIRIKRAKFICTYIYTLIKRVIIKEGTNSSTYERVKQTNLAQTLLTTYIRVRI